MWDEIGLADRPTFHDGRHLIIYGQRTADGRIAFGGRGAPYHFGSKVRPEFDTDERVRELLDRRAARAVPGAAGRRRSRTTGAACWQRRATGRVRALRPPPGSPPPAATSATASPTTHLAGRTLAALITGSTTTATRAGPVAVGRAPLAELGARTAALARRQRRAPRPPPEPTSSSAPAARAGCGAESSTPCSVTDHRAAELVASRSASGNVARVRSCRRRPTWRRTRRGRAAGRSPSSPGSRRSSPPSRCAPSTQARAPAKNASSPTVSRSACSTTAPPSYETSPNSSSGWLTGPPPSGDLRRARAAPARRPSRARRGRATAIGSTWRNPR